MADGDDDDDDDDNDICVRDTMEILSQGSRFSVWDSKLVTAPPRPLPHAKYISQLVPLESSHCIMFYQNWSVRGVNLVPFVNLLLTYSMVQSPSWEANWFAASQEIHRISRNPKVHYRTHKRPPTVSILGQPNPVHMTTSHLLEIRPNIIHPSTPRSPQWFSYLRFPPYKTKSLSRFSWSAAFL